jgi:simple sugar transport system substrate-binding protein
MEPAVLRPRGVRHLRREGVFVGSQRVIKGLCVLATVGAGFSAAACGGVSKAGDNAKASDGAAAATQPAANVAANPRLEGFTLAPHIRADIKAGKQLNFVYITNDLSLPYTSSQRVGAAKAAKDLGVTVDVKGPPSGQAQDQVSLIQTLVTQKKVDGIVVAAVNVDSLKPVIDQAFAAGIPLISAFTDQPNSKQLAYVGTDNKVFGKAEGEKFANYLKGKSGPVVALSVDTGAGWSTDRMAGLKEGLQTGTSLKMVGPINTGSEPAQMQNAIQNAMKAHPDAIAIASVDCCSIDGAARWAQTSGKGGKIPVIGTDALKQTLGYIKSGVVPFALSQDPVGQVSKAVKQIYDFETKNIPPKTVLMPPLTVDKSNADTVTPEG